jgi:hypothetical protein
MLPLIKLKRRKRLVVNQNQLKDSQRKSSTSSRRSKKMQQKLPPPKQVPLSLLRSRESHQELLQVKHLLVQRKKQDLLSMAP